MRPYSLGVTCLPRSVLGLIERRVRQGSRPGARKRGDQAHLALAVEGGGMRGAVSAGMLVALERLGALQAFDSVWGASAGAINSAFFLTGQAGANADIYSERLASSRFINPRRFLRGGDFISLDYMFSLLKSEYRLDVERLLESPIKLHPISFCLDDWSAVDLGHPKSEDGVFLSLRASSQVPLFAGKPIEVDGRRFLDAACGEFIPVQSALKGGATHVLVLHTRPDGLAPAPVSRIERAMYQRWLRPIDARLVDYFEHRPELYRTQMTAISQLGAHVFSIHPSGQVDPVAVTERRREPVVAAFRNGLEAMLAAWPDAEPEQSLRQWLTSWPRQLLARAL